jgi:pilus assembly protein CpaB
MKNKRALVVMAIAILFGLTAVILASRWLLLQPTSSAGHIAVAATDINLGQRLTPAKLAGRVLKSSLLAGEPVSEAKLAPAGTLGGLSALITEGKRAITVRVNDVIGVAGFTLPGNYVDIIVSTQKDPSPETNAREESISKIVLERILVLAVAQEVNRDETKPRVVNAVTLEVTPEQAEKLDLARSVGTLSLALRNQVDPLSAQTEGATKLTLLPVAAPIVKPAPPKPAAMPRRPEKPTVLRVATPPVRRNCVSVINGLHSSQECL